MKLGSWSMTELLAWRKWGVHEERKEQVRHPCLWNWEDDVDRIKGAFKKEIREFLEFSFEHCTDAVVRTAVEAMIAACFAGRAEPFRNLLEDLKETLPRPDVFFPFSVNSDDFSWTDCRWIMADIGSETHRGDGKIYSMLIGVSEKRGSSGGILMPEWWERVADRSARSAVRDALCGFTKKGLTVAIWPIIPVRSRVFVSGGSIGLAVYAGVFAVLKDIEIPCEIVFSGIITAEGGFRKPSHLEQKLRAVSSAGFCLVYPDERYTRKPEAFPVRNEKDLILIMKHYSPEVGNMGPDVFEVLRTPENLVTRIHRLSREAVSCGFFQSAYGEVVRELLALGDGGLLADFARNLERFCLKFSNAPDVCMKLLEPLSDNELDKIAEVSREWAWRIIMCKYACFTAAGNAEAAGECYQKALGYLPEEEQTKKLAEVQNRHFVHTHHMCFRFGPEIPKEFLSTMERLEKI